MARHKWRKEINYWECEKCNWTKQKDWGLPWFYFEDGSPLPVFKAPECKPKEE